MTQPDSNPNQALHAALSAKGWSKTKPNDQGAYERHGSRYLTWRKDGVTVASSGTSKVYNKERGHVEVCDGCGYEVTIEALTTDAAKRGHGLAKAALRDWAALAYGAGVDLYLEPVPLEPGITLDRLIALYSSVGFSPSLGNIRVMSLCRPDDHEAQRTEHDR